MVRFIIIILYLWIKFQVASRKRSFIFTRLFIFISYVILKIINVSAPS